MPENCREALEEMLPSSIGQRISDLKLLLWSFDKIGDVDRIKRAYKSAMEAIQ